MVVTRRPLILLSYQTYRPCDVVLDGDDETLVLVFDEVLGVGEGVLGIEFSAALNEHFMGFYRGWALFFFFFFCSFFFPFSLKIYCRSNADTHARCLIPSLARKFSFGW
jgi:hypothetical protein